jgi:hypothetical protein
MALLDMRGSLALLVEHLRLSLSRAPVVTSPFCHFAVTDAFPEALYAAMLDNLPPLSSYRPEHPEKLAAAWTAPARATCCRSRRISRHWTRRADSCGRRSPPLADDSIRRLVLRS